MSAPAHLWFAVGGCLRTTISIDDLGRAVRLQVEQPSPRTEQISKLTIGITFDLRVLAGEEAADVARRLCENLPQGGGRCRLSEGSRHKVAEGSMIVSVWQAESVSGFVLVCSGQQGVIATERDARVRP